MKNIKLGVCEGRHLIKEVQEYIFGNKVDPTNVDGLKKEASKVLLEKFNKVSYRSICIGSNTYTDTTIEYRGELILYVTGLTVAVIAILNACYEIGVQVTLMHYNSATGEYYPQEVRGVM